jgi:hypothetical protein
MVRSSKWLWVSCTAFVLLLLLCASSPAYIAAGSQQEEPKTRSEKRAQKRVRRAQQESRSTIDGQPIEERPSNGTSNDEINLEADRESKIGELLVFEGYVNVTHIDMRLQADHATYNESTADMVAEGNVIFDQGPDQRVTAKRAEINWDTGRGTFWDTTGFTNRTQTGDYIFYTADRVEKTGPETYEMINATVTACEDAVPKWVFGASRAELKLNDRLILRNAVFRVKNIPAFVMPYAWIPATRTERKSGFLIPSSGTSNLKGRTFKFAYYQTLGPSADITFRNDIYTKRGIGTGAEFRAQTDEKSYMRLGVFRVFDRLFGDPGENQGGTAFVAEGVQYLPKGWLAVGNVSLVSSLQFRQVFSDDISQVVDPRRESSFYATNNATNFSFNLLASNETTRLFRPSRLEPPETPGPITGTDFDIKIRQAPQIDMLIYPQRIFQNLPIYFSLDTSLGALKREETVLDTPVFSTPAAVQRFDLKPKITIPLATFGGFAVTPSLSLRQTYYSSSLDPNVAVFDPDRIPLDPSDPRLDPTSPSHVPGLTLFDRSSFDPIIPTGISRRYAEFELDIRPPAVERVFLNSDGSRRFKHLIEPYLTYRAIRGIGDEFDNIIRFDERDAVANTNEVEYAVVNRFFINREASDFTRRRTRRQDRPGSEMVPLSPAERDRSGKKSKTSDPAAKPDQPPATDKPAEPVRSPAAETKQEQTRQSGAERPSETKEAEKKQKLESGKQDELTKQREGQPEAAIRDDKKQSDLEEQQQEEEDLDDAAGNRDAPVQPYEFLSIKVAQKYFFDRNFGGALVEGRRNQFYPINTLSGFTFGGRARSFSPANIQVRYRPLSAVYADVRMDVGADDEAIRNLSLSAGVSTDRLSLKTSWYLSRRIDLDANRFEPGTFPGNQLVASVQFGNESLGFYGGSRISYDFTDRFVVENELSTGRLRHSRSYFGYGWDCCGVQFNYNTFKAGVRNESAFSFSFTLAGIGTFGSDQLSHLDGGGGRRKGKKSRRDRDDDIY